MAITILDAPLNISKEDLQAGIQNKEDAAWELVDLTKGTSAGVAVNLVSFQPRTESLGNITLVSTPSGLFIQNDSNYTVDGAVSATFVKSMGDAGFSVVLYCPIVSINGSDTSLAVLRQIASPPVIPFNPGQPTSLSWDNSVVRKPWSLQLIAAVSSTINQLEQGNPDAFLTGYSTLTSDLRIKFWAELLVAVAKFESGWNPHDIFHEGPPLNVDSVGLLQLSYQDQTNYPLEPLSPSARSLEDPLVNIRCGVKIFSTLLSRDRTVANSINGRSRGASAYWSVLRANHKVDQIKALTKKNVGL